MTPLLGIPVYDGTLRAALDEIVATCTSPTAPRASRLVSLTGAHGLVHAQTDRAFADVLRSFTLNLPDGLPGVWVGRHLKGAAQMEQIRGADFFAGLMERSAVTPVRHYLCGGRDGVAARLRDVCRERFGNVNVVGTYVPPFRPLDEAEWRSLAASIESTAADVVWIGLGTPKQEMFARELGRRARVHYIATVGAAFDFHVGDVAQAPRWIRRAGFEWFYRMCSDPKRLVRRYAEIVPKFIAYNVLDLFGSRSQRNPSSK